MKKILALFLIMISSNAYAAVNNITEEDGSPSVYPWKLKFPNSSVTDNGDGTVSVVFSGGSGDVTAVGDCASGDCLDGSSDGGTYIRLYDGDSHYGAFVTENLSGNRTYTFPNFDGTMATLAGSEALTNKTYAGSSLTITNGAIQLNETSGVGGLGTIGIDSAGSAEINVDRGGTSFSRTALFNFKTAGTNQFSFGLFDTTDTVSFTDESGNNMWSVTDGGSVGNMTVSGTFAAAATTVSTLDTGQGATEVYLMNQNVRNSDAVTFLTVDTGQGANELYAMNQPVRTSDDVTFDDATLRTVVMDGTPNTDHTSVGPTTATFNAGATITVMDLVYMGSSSKWLLADADAAATSGGVMLAISLESKTDTQAMNVALSGSFVRDDTWNWTPGAVLYVDTATAGGLTATQPSGTDDVIRVVGFAVTADVIYFDPSPDYITHT